MSKNILVTGGIGFIGYHLCLRLLKDGHQVICVDDCSSSLNIDLEQLRSYNKFFFLNHDIRNTLKIKSDFDEIYNLACPASPKTYQNNSLKTIQTNTSGVNNILEIAREYNAKILQASTSEIYGNPLVHPQNEQYNGNISPIGPRACYSESKRCAETYFYTYYKLFNTKIKIARIFNTYGPYMKITDGRVIPNFIYQAYLNNPLIIYGDGEQTRSFCYIDDMINGLIKLMEDDNNFIGPVNIGNPEEISINNLAKLILDLTESTSAIKYESFLENDPMKRKPDISIAINKLDWKPTISITDGIKQIIKTL